MKKHLRVLIVEDSEDDALMIIRQLKKSNYEPEHERVETAEALKASLAEKYWDIILCDYNLPNFSGLAAIAMIRKMGMDLPIIMVSGAIGEEIAVESIKVGANDYIMKGNMVRLASAIEREMQDADMRSQQRVMMEALEASQQKFHKLFYNSPVAMALTSLEEDKLLEVNDEFLALTQYSREELIGRCTKDISVWANPADRDTLMEEMKLKGRIKGFPVTLRKKSGETVSLLFSADSLEIAGNQCLITSALDITERQKAEEAVRASEKRLSEIIDFFPDATFVVDCDGKVITWNNAIEAMTGLSKAEMIGKGDYEYAIPFYGERRPILIDLALNFRPDMEKSYSGIEKKGDILLGEAFAPNLPGGEAHLSATSSVLRDKRGNIVGAIECIRDNTEKKKAQEGLLKAEEQYRSIFENAQEGIYRSTPEGKIILANQAMAKIFGFDSPEELTSAITDVAEQLYVHHEDREKLKAMVEERGTVRNYEAELRRKDGTHIWVSMNMSAVRAGDGRIIYYEGLDEDISARRLSSERMRKALGATVRAIAVTVETRDPYTAGHQRRSADLAQAIAALMNLSADQIEGIRTAAIIHDLGKISVPAEILSKPTQLTPIEFELIKTHAQAGYDILKDIDFPWPVARIIIEHHERMDGSGYPRGLKGDETLLESHILQVADVVESMASHRPYRPSVGMEATLAEIEENKGILYDEDVVRACIRLFRDHGYRIK